MASKNKRMTFVLTPEMEKLLDSSKKELFYSCSHSEMIRTLIIAGLNTIKDGNEAKKTETGQDLSS